MSSRSGPAAGGFELRLILIAASAPDNRGHDDDRDGNKSKKPLVIKEQGSFFVGGVKVQAPGTLDIYTPVASTSDDGQIYHYDRLYAEYQIPRNPRKYNIILIHGGGGTGKVWDTTPNGDEGYKTLWLRRGFPVYTVDFPRRGRADYPSFNGPFGELAGDTDRSEQYQPQWRSVGLRALAPRIGISDFLPGRQVPQVHGRAR